MRRSLSRHPSASCQRTPHRRRGKRCSDIGESFQQHALVRAPPMIGRKQVVQLVAMLFHGRLRQHCIGNSSIGDCDGHCHDIHVDSDRGQIGSCYHRRCTCYCCTMEWMPAPMIMLQSASWSHVRRVIEEATFHGVTTLHGKDAFARDYRSTLTIATCLHRR